MNQKWVQRTAVEYAQGWNNLLPTGAAWPREPTAVLQEVISGLATVWGDPVEASAALLLMKESDPRITNMLLPDWERAWGLPDVCFPAPGAVSKRQTLLVQKMTLLGAQSREFFTAQAALIGYTINIHEWSPYMCGISQVGDTRNLDDGTHYYWEVGAPEMRFWWQVHVTAMAGADLLGSDIQCLFTRWKPAHTGVLFNYSGLYKHDFSRAFNVQQTQLLVM